MRDRAPPHPLDPPRAGGRPLAVLFAAVGAAVVLLAGEPGGLGTPAFSTGAVLRNVLLALLTGGVLFAAWAGPVSGPRPGPLRLLLLVAPLAVGLLALQSYAGDLDGLARSGTYWLVLALLPLGLLWLWTRARDARLTWTALVLAGCVAACFVVIARLAGSPAVGPFGRAGIAGPVLGALVAPALLLTAGPWQRFRWGAVVLLSGACVATGSRTGIVAMVLGAFFALAVSVEGARTRRRLMSLGILGVAVLVVVFGLMVRGTVTAPFDQRTLDVRLGLHRTSLQLVSERPIQGHGLGSYPTVALEARDLEEARLEPRRRPRHAHLDYLHVSVEGGVLAGLVLLGYVGLLLAVGVRSAAAGAPGRRRALAGPVGVVATLGVAALGDGVLLDPAPVLLLACAAATLMHDPRVARHERAPVLWQFALPLGAGFLLFACFVLAKDALADRALMRYRAAIGGGVTLEEAATAARRHLAEGALRWRSDMPEALYRLGVHKASVGRYGEARRIFRDALAADAGLTEARLDLAQVYRLEGRPEDAQAALEEARRRDPTRYEVRRALVELALGPEPVPGDPPREVDEVRVLRLMNEARMVAPDRFENRLDEARFARRRARTRDGLAEAGALLRAALKAAPGEPQNPPAEILLESFRLAEAEDTASQLFCSSILMQALMRNPRPAHRFRAEAERLLADGQRRQEAALEQAGGDPANLDMRGAERAFAAAAVRFTALLYTGLADPKRMLAAARADRDAGQFRRALARYRSLLAWTLPAESAANQVSELRGPARLEALAKQGDLLLEAASVAHRVDRALSLFYRTQGQLRIGVELLEKNRTQDALRKLRSVVESDPRLWDARYALARALARTGAEDEAEPHLIEALERKPALRGLALAEPDLAALRRRTAIKRLLDID